MQVHLVDGTYELYRQFYAPGASSRREKSARPGVPSTTAARALARSMLTLLAEPEVTHLGIAFDTVIESFRNQLFDGYKTGDGIDPELFAQFPVVEDLCEALGMVVWRMRDFEADDALATMAARAANDARVERVVICSPDKDLAQCIRGSRVVRFDRVRDLVLDEDGVRAKHGVSPASIPDLLALIGDTADGIPGIPRWGEKSAAAVLAAYGHVDAIPNDDTEWSVKIRGAAALAKELAARRQEAQLYRQLATLREDVPLSEDVDALEWRGADRAKLTAICARLGDASLVERVMRFRGE